MKMYDHTNNLRAADFKILQVDHEVDILTWSLP